MTRNPNSLRSDPADRPKKRGPYDSGQMGERRRRMIAVAKEMIAESGGEGFTIRDLTRRAGVSVTVVYSAYGDKEGLLAAAIRDFYDNLPLARRRPATTLDRMLREIDAAARIILENRAYSRAVAQLYFSPTADDRIYRTIREIAVVTFLPWLESAGARGETAPGVPIEALTSTLANDRWGVIFDWARDRVPDDGLAKTMRTSFLVAAAGATIGDTRREVEAALAPLWSKT